MPNTYMQKLRINGQGYTPDGSYWGVGAPVWQWTIYDATGREIHTDATRAATREQAKSDVLRYYPNATFYR